MTDDLLMGIPVMYPSHVKQLLYADILDMVEARLQATQKTLELLSKNERRLYEAALYMKSCCNKPFRIWDNNDSSFS